MGTKAGGVPCGVGASRWRGTVVTFEEAEENGGPRAGGRRRKRQRSSLASPQIKWQHMELLSPPTRDPPLSEP